MVEEGFKKPFVKVAAELVETSWSQVYNGFVLEGRSPQSHNNCQYTEKQT